MDTKKEAKKYLNKYFKTQYIKETDDEYKALVRILNKALRIHDSVCDHNWKEWEDENCNAQMRCTKCRTGT